MSENKKVIEVALSIIAVSLIILCVVFIQATMSNKLTRDESSSVMTIEEVANYLKLSQGEVIDLIETENAALLENGVHHGLMFPYYKMNNKYFFVKTSMDDWLKETSEDRNVYETKESKNN